MSGSRHFDSDAGGYGSSPESSSDSGPEDEADSGATIVRATRTHPVSRRRIKRQPNALDTTAELWDFTEDTGRTLDRS